MARALVNTAFLFTSLDNARSMSVSEPIARRVMLIYTASEIPAVQIECIRVMANLVADNGTRNLFVRPRSSR